MGCLDSSRGGRLWPTSFLLCGKMSAVRRALPKFRPTPRRAAALKGCRNWGQGAIAPLPDQGAIAPLPDQGGRLYSPHYYSPPPPGFSEIPTTLLTLLPTVQVVDISQIHSTYIIASSTTKHIFPAKSLLSQSESIQKNM